MPEVVSRTQGSRPRPRTKDTSASALQKKKKKKKRSSQKFFRRSPQKNVFQKIFQALDKILAIQKIVLSSRTPPLINTFELLNLDTSDDLVYMQNRLLSFYNILIFSTN